MTLGKSSNDRTELNYQTIIDALDDILFIIDNDFYIEEVNENALKLLNKKKKEVVGKKCYEVIHHQNAPVDYCPICKSRESGKTFITEQQEELFGKYFSVKSTPIKDKNGNIQKFVHLLRDITLLKNSEKEALKKSIEFEKLNKQYLSTIKYLEEANETAEQNLRKFQNMYDHNSTGIAIVSLDHKINNANQAYCNMLGYNENELTGKTLKDITAKDSLKENLRLQSELVSGKRTNFELEKKFIHKDGHIVYGILNATLVKDTAGEPLYFIGNVTDITRQKQVEAALKESEDRYRSYIEQSNDAIFVLDEKGRHIDANKKASELLEYSIDEIKKLSYREIVAKEHIQDSDEKRAGLRKGKKYDAYEKEFISKTGKRIPVEITVAPIKSKTGKENNVLSIVRDISERKQAQHKLKESEKKFRALYENAPLAYQSLDTYGNFIDINPAWLEILGYKRDEVIGQNYADFLHPDWVPHFKKNFPEFKKRGYVHDVQFLLRHKKGHYIYVSFEGCVGYNADGTFSQTYCVFKDITDQKKIEDELRLSEEKFSKAFKSAPVLMTISTIDNGTYIDINDTFINETGYTREQAIGVTSLDLGFITRDDRDKLKRILETKGRIGETELKLRKADGNYMYCSYYGEVIKITGEQRLLSIASNITERKWAEQSIRQYEKTLELQNNISEAFILSNETELFHRVLTTILNYFNSKNGYIGFINKDGNLECPAHTEDFFKDCEQKDEQFILNKKNWKNAWGKSLKLKKTIASNKVINHKNIYNCIASPILIKNQLIGQIVVANKPKHYSDDEIEEITELCNFVSPLLQATLNEYQTKQELVDAKEEAERNEQRYQSFIKQSSEGIYRMELKEPIDINLSVVKQIDMIYENAYIAECNQKFAEMYGLNSVDEMIGTSMLNLHGGKDNLDNQNVIKEFILNNYRITNLETEEIDNDGNTLYFSNNNVGIIENGKLMRMWGIQNDITIMKKIQQELIKAKEKAEESDRLKSAFLANMSHEIRTPMNGIMGFSQMLQEREYPKKKQQRFLGIIHSRTRDLLRIINDIVDISKIEANQLTVHQETVCLNDILYKLYETYKIEIERNNKPDLKIQLETDLIRTESCIQCDPIRLKQILENLLSNALKFTDTGSIQFGYKKKGPYLEFFVQDTGIGIPKKFHNKIFTRFRQVDDSEHRIYDGTGLGLSICKSIVEMLGGKIWVESKKGEGSTFKFTIPFVKKDLNVENLRNKSEIADFNWSGKSILLIEDDPSSLEYISEVILPTGAELILKETGKEGMEEFNSINKPDLILMDIRLPDANGMELIKEIRKLDKNIKIIAQTAYAIADDRKKCLDAGADDYIPKPIDVHNFLTIIDRYIK